jgi:hypothetical protein
MAAPTDKPMGLVTKLATIMGALGSVQKEGFNTNQKYKFVRETDVVEALKPLLAEAHLFLYQTVTSCVMEPLYKTASGATMYLTTVHVNFQWMDGDSGESLAAASFVGTGADTGDKGAYKAMTGAEKYFLMKTFLISTGDDPEADEKVDKAAASAGAASAPIIRKAATPATVSKGGKPVSATSVQVREVFSLAAKLGLSGADIAALATKTLGGDLTLTGTAAEKRTQVIDFLSGHTVEEVGGLIEALMVLTPAESEAVAAAALPDPDSGGIVDLANDGTFADVE